MYAGNHERLFAPASPAPASHVRPRLENIDLDALVRRGRLERSRELSRIFGSAARRVKRLLG